MSFTKTAVLPVTPDEAFALITEPERLRRWQTVSAYVDLRAGGDLPLDRHARPRRRRAPSARSSPASGVVFGWGWEGSDDLPPDASTVTVTVEPADGRLAGHARCTRASTERAGRAARRGLGPLLRAARAAGHHGRRRPGRVGAGPPRTSTRVTAAEAVLAAIQPVLRSLTAEDQPKPTPCADFTCHDARRAPVRLARSSSARWPAATVVNPERGLAGEPRLGDGRPGHRRLARRRPRRHRPRPRRRRDARRVRRRASSRSSCCCTAGTSPRAAASELRVSDEVVAYVRTLAESVVPGGRARGSFADEVDRARRRLRARPARGVRRTHPRGCPASA